MKEKFTRELEQRREPEEGSSTYAVDQVEQAGRWGRWRGVQGQYAEPPEGG